MHLISQNRVFRFVPTCFFKKNILSKRNNRDSFYLKTRTKNVAFTCLMNQHREKANKNVQALWHEHSVVPQDEPPTPQQPQPSTVHFQLKSQSHHQLNSPLSGSSDFFTAALHLFLFTMSVVVPPLWLNTCHCSNSHLVIYVDREKKNLVKSQQSSCGKQKKM